MRIYDEQGQERDPVWLETMFGSGVRVDACQQSPAFRVVRVQESTSKTVIITVLDEAGEPMPGVDVTYGRPGGQRFRQTTGHDGKTGIPVGRDFRYGVPADEGPYLAGIPGQATDVVYGLGEVIVGGAPNRHLDITFQWLVEETPQPPPEPPAPAPSSPLDENWQQLFEKLDAIIALLKGRRT